MTAPRMSVILPTYSTFATIRRTINSLRGQSVVREIELVIVTPTPPESFGLDVSLLRDFHSHQLLRTESDLVLSQLCAAGVFAAKAPIVTLTEDHVFHALDWAEQLLESHQQPYAVVAAQAFNANPDTLLSWSDFLMGYGLWSAPTQSGPRDYLPGHNSSYKRDLLLIYGDQLADKMTAEVIIHWELRSEGHELYLNADAKMYHMNFSKWSSWMLTTFYAGRSFAGLRIHAWPPLKRLMYAAAWPLIPFVRLRRIWPTLAATPVFPRIVPVMLLQFVISAFGECIGYLFGAGDVHRAMAKLETLRDNHVRPRERHLENLNLPEGIERFVQDRKPDPEHHSVDVP